jgi:hypothetical protein
MAVKWASECLLLICWWTELRQTPLFFGIDKPLETAVLGRKIRELMDG